jgi:hypothetical protein
MNIDAEIAEKLFGWEFLAGFAPPYSKIMTGVGVILEALRKKGFYTTITYLTVDGRAHAAVTIESASDAKGQWEADEHTLPLALCKAALLALEGK